MSDEKKEKEQPLLPVCVACGIRVPLTNYVWLLASFICDAHWPGGK